MDGATAELAQVLDALETRAPADVVGEVLAAAREHLGVDLAFVAEARGDDHRVVYVSGDPARFGMAVGQRRRLEETICGLVLSGALPEVVADTRGDPRTAAYPFRSYAAAPIRFSDGATFGIVCAASKPPRRLRARHAAVLRLVADLIARQLEDQQHRWEAHCEQLLAVADVLDRGQPTILHQSIVDLGTGAAVGAEALARFESEKGQSPDRWFRDSWAVGYGVELELRAVERALDTLDLLPANRFLSINVSPQLPVLPEFMALIERYPPDRIVLELTEHSRLDDAHGVRRALQRARDDGLRVAVDDAGAGFAGLGRILDLQPDFIKLDAMLVRYVDSDPARAAMARALLMFSHSMGCTIVAEGVEHQRQADTLRHLGVTLAQGYLFSRPARPTPQLESGGACCDVAGPAGP